MPVKDAARQAVFDAITQARNELTDIGRKLHATAEAAGQETRTAELVCGYLETLGFEIERGIAGLPTAFRAHKENLNRDSMRKGARHAHVGLLMELNGDPASGHVEGHNQGMLAILAAATGLGAALEHENALVTVYGCPGVVADGGKLAMARAGLFEELDAALGARPAPTDQGFFYTINQTGDTRGSLTVTIELSGDAATDSIESAVTELVEKLTALRESLIEHESMTLTSTRSSVTGVLEALSRRRLTEIAVEMQLAANDLAGPRGLTASLSPSNVYDEMIVNRILARRMKTFSDNLGLRLDKIKSGGVAGPTDWGNVSYYTPTFVAHYPIVEREVVFGTSDFASAANSPEAYEASLRVAECLAFTSLDVIRDDQFRAIADDQLVRAMGVRGIERKHRRWTGLHPIIKEPLSDEEVAAAAKPKGPRVTEIKWVRGPGMPN